MPPTGQVLLYVPNLIGYARLACIIYGFHAPGVFDSAVRGTRSPVNPHVLVTRLADH